MDPEVILTPLQIVQLHITQVLASAFGWVGSVVTVVAGNPLLLVGALVSFAFVAVGLFKRLLHI